MIQQVLLSRYGVMVGLIEGLAVVTIGFTAFLVHERKRQLALVLVALGCVIAMIATWAIWINPINTEVNSWAATSVPDHWQVARDSWHRFHTIRLGLAALGFAAFAWAALQSNRIYRRGS